MKVSVVIPTFNAERYITATIESVLNQSHQDFEILVVDDCSTDNTVKYIREIMLSDSRINLIELDDNTGGPATPRNTGIKNASGEWLAFLDADDLWSPEKLSVQLTIAKECNVDFLCSKTYDFKGDKSSYVNEYCGNKFRTKTLNFRSLLFKNVIPTSSVLVRRDIIAKYNFNRDKGYVAVEDYALWLELARDNIRMIKILSPLIAYRILPGSISRGKLKQARKVARVITKALQKENKLLTLFMPVLFLSYIVQSIYFRLLKKAM
ncbi:teichuronic acid biosynthesis glycosyltransferase TuaG [Pseudidiomarina planktonica]|uniref:Teichuronic acid biosynthesis glycosyltransferase TuaG n=1 Tax=Pseudidiomarina planktonica TaxID=1323738 RepID=A0A1Y6EKG8_9GAMM|nr:glycosyltransferase family 2 protein [Pseudidiomarina planktonica]SMQ61701.1 teichuronic acid biosynthesis glycosyltransferase TuaG [Pseudidiomarina planktonica]